MTLANVEVRLTLISLGGCSESWTRRVGSIGWMGRLRAEQLADGTCVRVQRVMAPSRVRVRRKTIARFARCVQSKLNDTRNRRVEEYVSLARGET